MATPGRLGNYSHCSFSLEGTGRFTPLPCANPTIGAVNSPEEVPETRIEAIYPRSRRKAVVGDSEDIHASLVGRDLHLKISDDPAGVKIIVSTGPISGS